MRFSILSKIKRFLRKKRIQRHHNAEKLRIKREHAARLKILYDKYPLLRELISGKEVRVVHKIFTTNPLGAVKVDRGNLTLIFQEFKVSRRGNIQLICTNKSKRRLVFYKNQWIAIHFNNKIIHSDLVYREA